MRYLLVTYLTKPGGQIDEQLGFGKRVSDSDMGTCNVILDFKRRSIVKCTVGGQRINKNFDELTDYYRKIYPELIAQLETHNLSEGKPTQEFP